MARILLLRGDVWRLGRDTEVWHTRWMKTLCGKCTVMVLPASVRRIGDKAFLGCSSLASISAPGVEEIGDLACREARQPPRKH